MTSASRCSRAVLTLYSFPEHCVYLSPIHPIIRGTVNYEWWFVDLCLQSSEPPLLTAEELPQGPEAWKAALQAKLAVELAPPAEAAEAAVS
jgi:hypothetical protein